MKVIKFKIGKDKLTIRKPLVRMSTGESCGLEGCKCSEGYWITISDGQIGMRVTFKDEAEFQRFTKTHNMIKK